MKPDYERGPVRLYCGDCRDILPAIADQVDAVVTDPPYGIAYNAHRSDGRLNRIAAKVDGDQVGFEPPKILFDYPIVLWGANYYAHKLPGGGAWIIWDKVCDDVRENWIGSDCEVAYTNVGKTVKKISFHHVAGSGNKGSDVVHPTQKPVAVMRYSIRRLNLTIGATVVDPYIGSGTTAIAGVREGFKTIGIERDPDHFRAAVKRIDAELDSADFLSGVANAKPAESAKLFD